MGEEVKKIQEKALRIGISEQRNGSSGSRFYIISLLVDSTIPYE